MIVIIIGLLISTIGLLPLVLGFTIRSIFKEFKLSNVLFLYMIPVTIWQIDVGLLYFQNVFSEEITLFLFKLFRMGPTFSIAILLYLAYRIVKEQPSKSMESSLLTKIMRVMFSKITLIVFCIWSFAVYLINWTALGIKGLYVTTDFSIKHYFPEYGPLFLIFIIHMSSFFIVMFLVILLSKRIANKHFQKFLRVLFIHSLWLVIPGFINFSPATGLIASTFGVIVFSAAMVYEFVKLNVNLKSDYYQLMERQKKMYYMGNLASSLIHEVNNSNQIILGYLNLLNQSSEMTVKDKSKLEMIQKSSEHLVELVDNYKKYIKSSALTFKKENLEAIIKESINFSSEMLRKHNVTIEFENNYDSVNAYVNKANLKQAFINLIKNSIEAMVDNGENRKILIKIEMKSDTIIVHFVDTGKGISNSNWDIVFNPFISTTERGMGLGLPFVKKIIIEHFGEIRIEESTKKGTHFRIEIPQNGMLNNH